jgi:hypothetical protein
VRWRLAVEHNASDYRMMSSMCLEIANAMSLESDRVRLTARAQEWLELAHQAEAKRLPEITQGQYTGSVYEAVEPPKQSNTTVQENLGIADCPAIDEVMPDRAFESQDSQTQADPIANEILEIADGPALDVAPGAIPGSPGGRTEANPVAEGLLKIPSVPAVETSFPQPPASQFANPNAGMQLASHGVVTSRSWPMLTRLLLLAVFALFLTALFASMFQ